MSQDAITARELDERMAWPLDRKVKESWERIAAWVSYWGKEASVSFSGVEAELADVIIRAADFAEAKGYDLGAAILAKMEMNRSRPKKHGKEF